MNLLNANSLKFKCGCKKIKYQTKKKVLNVINLVENNKMFTI